MKGVGLGPVFGYIWDAVGSDILGTYSVGNVTPVSGVGGSTTLVTDAVSGNTH